MRLSILIINPSHPFPCFVIAIPRKLRKFVFKKYFNCNRTTRSPRPDRPEYTIHTCNGLSYCKVTADNKKTALLFACFDLNRFRVKIEGQLGVGVNIIESV
jgi:hypothetical protein